MKWILCALFLLATIPSNGQSQKHFYCLTEDETVQFAVRLKRIQDSVDWQKNQIIWQADMLFEKDKLIQKQKVRITESDSLIAADGIVIKDLNEENKKLRETIDYLTPKWYDEKWLWFAGGATVVTILVGILK